MYYYARALAFGGTSPQDAWQAVAAVADPRWTSPTVEQLFGWDLVRPRVLYPLLSAPFAHIWGIDGMSVVPALSYGGTYCVTAWLVARRFGRPIGLAVTLLALSCAQWLLFMLVPLTESPTALFITLTVWAASRQLETGRRRWLGWAAVFTILMGLTRQAMLIPAGAFAVAWLGQAVKERRVWNRFAPVCATVVGAAAAIQVFQLLAYPNFSQLGQYERMTGTDSLGGALLATPRLVAAIAKADLKFFATYDPAMLLFAGLALASLVVCWRQVEAHLLAGALAAVAVYQITNGVPGQQRYAVPALIFLVLAAGAMLRRLADPRAAPTAPVAAGRRLTKPEPGECEALPSGAVPPVAS
jgi:4-amino-4-deoxy-L-arabinose transferase-like glycosyltransferase